MRAKVLKAFSHTDTGRIWLKGETFVGDDDAAVELARKGFVEVQGVEARKEAPPREDLASLTVKELLAICAERGIETPPKAKKADIVSAIESAG